MGIPTGIASTGGRSSTPETPATPTASSGEGERDVAGYPEAWGAERRAKAERRLCVRRRERGGGVLSGQGREAACCRNRSHRENLVRPAVLLHDERVRRYGRRVDVSREHRPRRRIARPVRSPGRVSPCVNPPLRNKTRRAKQAVSVASVERLVPK